MEEKLESIKDIQTASENLEGKFIKEKYFIELSMISRNIIKYY